MWQKFSSNEPAQNLEDDYKPSIEDQITITREWWDLLTPGGRVDIPIMTMKRFFITKKFAPDLDTAEKIIQKALGQDIRIFGYKDFYRLFAKGIFRVAL